MKQGLYITTAILTAVSLSTAVSAVELTENMTLEGQLIGAIGDVDKDFVGADNRDLISGFDGELYLDWERILDNGMIIGAHATYKVTEDTQNDNGDSLKKAYLSGQWIFGEVQLGAQSGVAEQMALTAPSIFYGVNINDNELDLSKINRFGNDNTFSALGGGINTVPTLQGGQDETAPKLIYFSPRIAGFQAGVSYAPDQGNDGSLYDPTNKDFGEHAFEATISYTGSISEDVDLGVSLGYLLADDPMISEDPTALAAGVNIGFDNFTIGGSYKESQFIRNPGEYDAWDVGVTYETGAWGVMFSYAEDETEADPILGAAATDFSTEAYQLGVSYEFESGVTVGGGLQQIDKESVDPVGSKSDAESTVIFMETMLSF